MENKEIKTEDLMADDLTPEDVEFICSNEGGKFVVLKDKKTKSIFILAREPSVYSGNDFVNFRKLEIEGPLREMTEAEKKKFNPKD